MADSLKEETALLLEDYFQHCCGKEGPPPSPTAAELRRAAAELERRERPFFRSCAPLASGGTQAALSALQSVVSELNSGSGFNWGRCLATIVLGGSLATALYENGCEEGPSRLAAALAAYLAEEQGEWLREHGGWVSTARAGMSGSFGSPVSARSEEHRARRW
ncbi:similar to Apoptosis inhibitor, Bcl2 family proteins [Meleagrid alphaherpesvirus 1]|uniref:Apoptosis inhibitor-like protein n=1 Tax=Meleagrid herpesvirus 1 TaxID=37108 RepID=Q9DH00_MEHV1|nr:apoptosis inhibitor-like protein [Meleagrid alphaherpesvirus 1]AKQ48644.1 apoptosis inhibitor Bcl-2 [iBAC vector pMeHV1-C7]AKQ48716.1 apoptosis inhibitor Bcl-2 [iBAC vector pMeHV1-C9]AKQ48788.1 apoptosis inhibitor Bcl-2 [iBAC vector pMeHV1-C10]AKQ48860.1 apoptosis inhibitor Bcl-2 [iBAC vector pMeHV1-C17]AKQ48932.1 apoptosis inhibitor Bcl-2 [iBAC vector pMeHV1-C18]